VTAPVPAGSVAFDRAASCYDQTRSLPDQTAREQTRLLAAELAAVPGPVLEIGVGTGRIAVPLGAAGRTVIGVDLSGPMLGRLVAKQSPVVPVRATATMLPVRTASMAGVIACHVLHLIADWQQAVTEALRVLRPGGMLLVSAGRGAGRPEGGAGPELQRRLRAALGPGSRPVGVDDLDELDRFLRARDASVRELPAIPNPDTRSAGDYLRAVAANSYSWTWQIPAGRLAAAVSEVVSWVTETFGDPDQVQIPASPLPWRSYRLPGRAGR
jgi:SAM-dependent methyltransferase